MQDLAQERCFNHMQREAVARCPACARFFCRECITEHEDRVLCASCLQQSVNTAQPAKSLAFTRPGFTRLFLWIGIPLTIPSYYFFGLAKTFWLFMFTLTIISVLYYRKFIKLVQFLTGIFFLWLFFFYLGQALLSLPATFHEGSLWQEGWWNRP